MACELCYNFHHPCLKEGTRISVWLWTTLWALTGFHHCLTCARMNAFFFYSTKKVAIFQPFLVFHYLDSFEKYLVFWRMAFCLGLPDSFLVVKWWGWGKNTTEVKCPSHAITSLRHHDIPVMSWGMSPVTNGCFQSDCVDQSQVTPSTVEGCLCGFQLWWWWLKPLWTFSHRFLCAHQLLLHLGKYRGVGLLSHMGSVCLIS